MSTARRLVVVLAISAAACARTEPAPAETPAPITIGYSALRISLPVFVAQERGLFRAHGLRVTLRRYDTAQPLVEEVLDGRLDAGGYAAIPIVLTASGLTRSRHSRSAPDGSDHVAPPLHLATALIEDDAHPVSALLARRGDGAPTRVADLGGCRIGILPTVAYRKWLEAVLRADGVDPATVHIIPLPPAQQLQQLDDGAIDALFTGDPMATAAIARGLGHSLAPAPVPHALGGRVLFGSFLLSTELTQQRPRVAARVVAALDDAIAIIAREGRATYATMTPYVRGAERAFLTRYPAPLFIDSRSLTPALLRSELALEARIGIVEHAIDASDWIQRGTP